MATDTPLVLKAQKGNRRAFGELVRTHHAKLIAAARAMVGDSDAAEDLSQEAFVHAYASLRSLKHPERFKAWLFGILKHKALNHLRTAKREVPLAMVGDGPSTGREPRRYADGGGEELRERLDELPEQHREILAAKYVQDLSYAEIADALNLTVNAVRVRCHRAKQALRELIEQHEMAGTTEEEASQ
ncbi:MAG TPA: RNA polymerase sigma factor [Armatimonadota bacterium]|nr:RNA polymerase sigma factor [Armatimonadota bacterium]